MIPSDKLLLNTKEAAELLGVCQLTVQRWINEGRIEVLDNSTKFLIPRWALENFTKQASKKNGVK